MATAILIDGSFFLKRYRKIYGHQGSPYAVACDLYEMCKKHLSRDKAELYRIFFYDCHPLAKKIHHPITQQCIDLSKSELFLFRTEFHQELKKLRKVALRMGRLTEHSGWIVKPHKMKRFLNSETNVKILKEEDLIYDVRQKGVDIKIGLDIASLAYKKLVNQIILISGDSDFVPAAKLARREGIDFILDPMWSPIHPDLHEHIDGLRSACNKPKIGDAISEKSAPLLLTTAELEA